VGVCDDLHRELAEERLGLPNPQAIIGAGGARVERASRPVDLRPETADRVANDPWSLKT
jgi:hypothetical protein